MAGYILQLMLSSLDIYYGWIYITVDVEVAGSTAVVVGRSKIVGTPVAGESRHHCRWMDGLITNLGIMIVLTGLTLSQTRKFII